MEPFKKDENLLLDEGHGCKRVVFVKPFVAPLPDLKMPDPDDRVGRYPGPQPAVVVRMANGKTRVVPLKHLSRPD